MATIYIDNDMYISLERGGRLKDENGNYITGATVEVTLYEADGSTEVGGISWPIVLDEGSEDGEYFGVIPSEAEIEAGERYFLDIKATTTEGSNARWVKMVEPRYRTIRDN